MESAFKLFLKEGFSNVSNTDILEYSGAGSGTMYYHFEDRDDLIFHVLDKYIFQMLVERVKIVKSFEGDSYDTLSFMFKQLIGFDKEFEPYFVWVDSEYYTYRNVILLSCEGIQKNDKIRSKHREIVGEISEYVDEYVEKGKKNNEIRTDLSTKDLSFFIQINLTGYVLMIMGQENIDIEKVINHYINNTWNYIKSNQL